MVHWTAPQSDVTISAYIVEHRKSGAAAWGTQASITGSPPETSTQLPGLDAGTEYNVRVRAKSAAGEGEWSEVQTERTFNSKCICIISVTSCMCTYKYYILLL